MSTLLISIELFVLLVVTKFVAVPNACGAGGGVWEHLCSGMDGVNLLWDDFAGSLVRNSVWTVALGCSLSAGLCGLWIQLGISLVLLPQTCSLQGRVLKGDKVQE